MGMGRPMPGHAQAVESRLQFSDQRTKVVIMQIEFRCNNSECGALIDGRDRIRDDARTGAPAVLCSKCGVRHVATTNSGYSGGKLSFAIPKDPGDGTGGSTGDGGG